MGLSIKKLLLKDRNWLQYRQYYGDSLRDVEMSSINQVLSCRHYSRGHAHFICTNTPCTHEKRVQFTCKNRACSSCGRAATDRWIEQQKVLLPPAPWQHATLTMPSVLWPFFKSDRRLISDITRIAGKLLKKIAAKKGVTPGIFMAIHTFGRSMSWNVHGRKAMTLKGDERCSAMYKKYAKRAKNPWIILTSLSPEDYKPKDIINFYKTRMQIEESFRDLKDDYHGLGLVYNGSKDVNKITIALLIGAIVRFLLWALGRAVKDLKYHLSYQANTIRNRNVLSLFYIARQFLRNYKSYHKIDRPWRLVKINKLSLEFMYV